jgi:4-amino-4-deoxy-L-arabinose transferase-like glycosyltransferase
MPLKIPRALWVAAPMVFFLYFYHLGATGLLGPDEPRYASIGREMARSGDWITPRLWGEPWFEKPPLLYWMTGAAFRLGIGPDLAPRLPIALLAVGFLVFFWWALNREFGGGAAWLSTIILGTSIAWLGFSQLGVTDLPFTATFSAAMLLALPWIARRDERLLPLASSLLALAVLAKSLPALVLAAPLVLRAAWFRDLLRPRVVLPFLAVAVPWHILCYLRNGRSFVDTLFIQHQFGRFASDALKHVEPWWFYLPIVAGLLLPWTPLLLVAVEKKGLGDARRRFLAVWVLFGLLFFSAATNKLPGYVLPLLPAAAALMGIGLGQAKAARVWIAACALLLVAFLAAAPVLPAAVANGLSRAPRPQLSWIWLLPLLVAAAAWLLESRSRRLAATLCVAAGAAAGIVYLKNATVPELDRLASARGLWQEIEGRADLVCVADVRRDIRYGLNYYSDTPLPECADHPRPLRIVQSPGRPPEVVAHAARGAGWQAAGGGGPTRPWLRAGRPPEVVARAARGAGLFDRREGGVVISRFRD